MPSNITLMVLFPLGEQDGVMGENKIVEKILRSSNNQDKCFEYVKVMLLG